MACLPLYSLPDVRKLNFLAGQNNSDIVVYNNDEARDQLCAKYNFIVGLTYCSGVMRRFFPNILPSHIQLVFSSPGLYNLPISK